MAFNILSGYSETIPVMVTFKGQLFLSTSDNSTYFLQSATLEEIAGHWLFDNLHTVKVTDVTGVNLFSGVTQTNENVWYVYLNEDGIFIQSYNQHLQSNDHALLVTNTVINNTNPAISFDFVGLQTGDVHIYYSFERTPKLGELHLRRYNEMDRQWDTLIVSNNTARGGRSRIIPEAGFYDDYSLIKYHVLTPRSGCQSCSEYTYSIYHGNGTRLANAPYWLGNEQLVFVDEESFLFRDIPSGFESSVEVVQRFDVINGTFISSEKRITRPPKCMFPIYQNGYGFIDNYYSSEPEFEPYDNAFNPLLTPVLIEGVTSSRYFASISCINFNKTLVAILTYDGLPSGNYAYSVGLFPIPPIITVNEQTVVFGDAGMPTFPLSSLEDQSFDFPIIAVTHCAVCDAELVFTFSDLKAGMIRLASQSDNVTVVTSPRIGTDVFRLRGYKDNINNLPIICELSPHYNGQIDITVSIKVDASTTKLLFPVTIQPQYDAPVFPNLPASITLYRDEQPYLESIEPDNPDGNMLELSVVGSFPEGIQYIIESDRFTSYGTATGTAFGEYPVTFSATDGIQVVSLTRTYSVLYPDDAMFHPDLSNVLSLRNGVAINESLPALLSPDRQTYMLPVLASNVSWLQEQSIDIHKGDKQIWLTGRIAMPVGAYPANISVTYGEQTQHRSITVNVLDSSTQVFGLEQGYTSDNGQLSITYALRDPDPNQVLVCEVDPRNPEVNQYITTHQKVVSDPKWLSAVDCQVAVGNLPYGLYSWDMGSQGGNSVSVAVNVEEPIPFHRTPAGIATIAVITGLVSPLLIWRLKLGCENPGRQRDYFLGEVNDDNQDLKVARAITANVLFYPRGKAKEHVCLPLPGSPLKSKGCFGRFDTGNGKDWDATLIQVISALNERLGGNQQLSATKLHQSDNTRKLHLLQNTLRHIIKHRFRCRRTLAVVSCGIFAEVTAHSIRNDARYIATLLYNELTKNDTGFFHSITEPADAAISTYPKDSPQSVVPGVSTVELGSVG